MTERVGASGQSPTPGPWAVDGGTVIISTAPWPMDDGPTWQDWEAKGGEPLGRFVAETRTNEAEGEANARLIASAPDLLRALKIARCNGRFDDPAWGEEIDEAIAKATGAVDSPRNIR